MDRRTFLKSMGLVAAGCCVTTPSIALADENNPETVTLSAENAIEMANRFINSCYPEEQIIAANPVRLLNQSGQHIGYAIDFLKSGSAFGYIVIDVTAPQGIAEYSIGEGSLSPYSIAIQNSSSQSTASPLNINGNPTFVKIDPLKYGVINPSNGKIYMNDGTVETAPPVATPYSAWGDATIPISDFYANYSVSLEGHLPVWQAATQERVIALTGHYACAVTAYFTVAGLFGLVDLWFDGDEYMSIWNYTGTTVDTSNTDPSAIWGSTNRAQGAAGFKNYCASKGLSISYQQENDPIFTRYSQAIDAQKPVLFHAQSYGGAGHAVVVEGYLMAIRQTDGAWLHVLMVADGWYSGVRYINCFHPGFTNRSATIFL